MIRMGSLFVCRQSHQAPIIIVILINPPFFEKKRGVSFHCRPLFAFIGTGNILLASTINSPDIKIRTVSLLDKNTKSGFSASFFRIGGEVGYF